MRAWLDSFWGDALDAFKLEKWSAPTGKEKQGGEMSERVAIAPVRKSVHVRAPIAHAFEVFTSGLTRWWPQTTASASSRS